MKFNFQPKFHEIEKKWQGCEKKFIFAAQIKEVH